MANQPRDDKWERRNGDNRINEEEKLNLSENDIVMDSISEMGDIGDKKDLRLRSKHLAHLPEAFGLCLKSLKFLDLADNELTSLPCSAQHLTGLETLILDDNRLTSLPRPITHMQSLRILNLAGNCIRILPENFGDLVSLEMVNLSSNCLKELPESCAKLERLKNLDLSSNELKTLPSCIVRGVRALETLDVSNNFHINIAMAPSGKKLRVLYARRLGYNVKFPAWCLGPRAPQLQVLVCDGTTFKIFDFPKNCQTLKLRTLSLDSCRVYEDLVKEITSRTNDLERLRLSNDDNTKIGNAFWKLPIENVKRPKVIREISVRATGIHSITEKIGNFINLVKLDVRCNNIYRLPDEICLLTKLELLLTDENNLTSFPEDIGRLMSLKELKASGNHIAQLPQSIKNFKQLLYLDLYDNEFQHFPKHLNEITSLLGMDIDGNGFNVDDFNIGDTYYEALRNTLRDHYEIVDGSRTFGPRYEIESSDEISDSVSDTSSSTYNVDENVTNVEENWDLSDNSADEFDPNGDMDPSKRKIRSFSQVLWERFAFCPADLHIPSVRHQVMLKKQNGEIEDGFQVEEGQFDDA